MVPSRSYSRQGGAALLLFMLIVIVATTTVLLANMNRDDLRARRLADTAAALSEAKELLIEYAVVHGDISPGQPIGLPCPDVDSGGGYLDGEAHTSDCGIAGGNVMGRLPWRTLGMPASKDATAECVWYAVSGSYKHAGAETAEMINADSNGQLQFVNLDTGAVVQGAQPQDRPVAMVIAPMRALAGQVRPAAGVTAQCSSSFDTADFLEEDAATGVSNIETSGAMNSIDVFASFSAMREHHNDRVMTISRDDIAARLYRRPDFEPRMRSLALGIASCIAHYGQNNPGSNSGNNGNGGGNGNGNNGNGNGNGGSNGGGNGNGNNGNGNGNGGSNGGGNGNGNNGNGNGNGGGNGNNDTDARLPWPATVSLADYRDSGDYDDTGSGILAGRVPDLVDDSNLETDNPAARILSDCDTSAVSEWSAAKLSDWQHWKDHFFYAVAESFAPSASIPTSCGDCLSVNGSGDFAAVVIFSNRRLNSLGQVRNAPPTDADTKNDAANYLEASNAANVSAFGASADYTSGDASDSFNDILYCIDQDMVVTEC